MPAKLAPPAFIAPCKPALSPKPPSGSRWVREVKFDGYRIGVRLDRGRATFLSSSGLDYTERLGERLAAAVRALPADNAYVDAELVVDDEDGISDFGLLQADLAAGRHGRMRLYAFDLLWLDGRDLRPMPLMGRKTILEALLGEAPRDAIVYSQHFEERSGARVLEHACKLNIEGIVSKLRDSRYASGDCRSWSKSVCVREAHVLIGGYEPSAGAPGRAGSLFIGAAEGGRVLYRGHVGVPGEDKARAVAKMLEAIRREGNPFADASTKELRRRGVRFVEPKLQAVVRYRGITEAGRFRHPILQEVAEPKVRRRR